MFGPVNNPALQKMEESARRGAALLDQNVPEWYDKVSITKLDIDSMFNCVLGQLYGDFCNGLYKLNDMKGVDTVPLYGDRAEWFGFITPKVDEEENATDKHYAHYLSAVWKVLIRDRRYARRESKKETHNG